MAVGDSDAPGLTTGAIILSTVWGVGDIESVLKGPFLSQGFKVGNKREAFVRGRKTRRTGPSPVIARILAVGLDSTIKA